MDKDTLIACAGTLLSVYHLLRKNKLHRSRKCKVKKTNRNRKISGFYTATFIPMKKFNYEQFFNYTRMSVGSFNKLLSMLMSRLTHKQVTDTVCAEERLAVTLHYLTQGTSMKSLAWTYQLGRATTHNIIYEVCAVLWEVLQPVYLNAPSTEEEWHKISKDFYEKWNFPNCIGALDGKHINIQKSYNSGWKKSSSIILLASCDANYCFTLIDLDNNGSENDTGVFRDSAFGTVLDTASMNLPHSTALPGTNVVVPYVLVADESFPLKSYLMRPYPGKNKDERKKTFNRRLFRAQHVIENAFGVMVARWRILKQCICADVKNTDNIVKAIICLHNFALKENFNLYCPTGYVDSDTRQGDWRLESNGLESVGRIASNNASRLVIGLRDKFTDFFCT